MPVSKSELICIANIIVKQENLTEVLKIFEELTYLSNQEFGCLRYELFRDLENPLHFTFVDKFQNQEAFDYHCAQQYTIKYFDEILPNITHSIEFTTYYETKFK